MPRNSPANALEDTDLREDLEIEDPEDDLEPELEEGDEPEEPEAPQETAVEKQARQLGWHPQSEYRGPPGQWKDAASFMAHGRDILPVLRDNLKRALDNGIKQSDEIDGLKRSMAEQAKVLGELREMARTASERGYNQKVSELEAERRQAVAAGDTEAYDQVSQQIRVTEQEREKAVPPKETTPSAPPPNQVPQPVLDFVSANPWYNNDAQLNRAMQGEHVRLRAEYPDQSLEDNLAEAKATVMKRFPDKFPKPNGARQPVQQQRAPVAQPSGGRNGQQPRQQTTGLASIEDAGERAIAKQQFARMQRQFADYSEEEYMAAYNNPHGDILTVQRALKEKRRGK